jgi:hypothetical protein
MKLHYINIALSLALVTVGMAGCLKDKPYDDQQIQSTRPNGTPRVIEMKISASNTKNFVSVAFDNSPNDTVIDLVPINLATADAAGEDINVTLELKPDLIQTYNDSNQTSYEVPPASLVSIVNTTVTIPKGSHTGYMQVKFKPADIIGHEYAYGLAITSVDKQGYTISGNLSSGIVAILIKNKYDGTYKVDGSMTDVVNPALSSVPGDPYPFEVELRTTGANSVAMWGKGIDFGHFIATGSYYGSFSPNFTFDPATNQILSITNYWGQPASNGRSAEIDATKTYTMNADKSFDIKYFMRQNGGIRSTFTEHFTYEGPR